MIELYLLKTDLNYIDFFLLFILFSHLIVIHHFVLVQLLYPLPCPLRGLKSHCSREENCATMRKLQQFKSNLSTFKICVALV